MDHYTILGLGRNANQDEIKKAYRKLASQHHPDKGGDTAKFQQIEEAYRILSDPQKKQEYDNPVPQGMHGFPGGFSFHVNGFDINDMFGSMFGQHAHNPFHTRSAVFRTSVNITLENAYTGSTQQLKLQTNQGPKFINIDVPKGIKNGDQMRYDHVLDNATLIVEFRIMPNLKFERRGNDLYTTHRINLLDLIVGNTFTFTTISNKKLEVTVQPKTQPNLQLKLPGHGMPIDNTGQYGDQIIVLNPYMPDTISDAITQSILHNRNN